MMGAGDESGTVPSICIILSYVTLTIFLYDRLLFLFRVKKTLREVRFSFKLLNKVVLLEFNKSVLKHCPNDVGQ